MTPPTQPPTRPREERHGDGSRTRQAEATERMYRWGRIVAARVMRDELGQTNPVDIEDAESVSHYAVAYALGRYDRRRGEMSTLIALAVRQRVTQWWMRDYRHRRGVESLTRFNAGQQRMDEPLAEWDLDGFLSRETVRRCLRQLPEKDQRLLVRFHIDARTYAQLAQEEGRSVEWVGQHLSRARRRFAELAGGRL